jgi:hypothetical protein
MRGEEQNCLMKPLGDTASKRNTAKRLYRRHKIYIRGGREAIKQLGAVNVRWYRC